MEDATPQGVTRSGGGGIKSPGLPLHTAGPHSHAKNRIFKNQRGKTTFGGYPTKVGVGKTARFLISREIKIINEIK